jgi:hypothetical protein
VVLQPASHDAAHRDSKHDVRVTRKIAAQAGGSNA